MHLVVFNELQRMHVNKAFEKIVPEQNVLLDCGKGHCERQGRFDFLVLTREGKNIGFEVLSRPSHGKLKEKLSYAKEVDEFVFVLPLQSMEFYRKNSSRPFKKLVREKEFCSAFSGKNLFAWLLDSANARILHKGCFGELFNVCQKE